MRASWALLPVMLAACAIPPKDPFLRAERALASEDLLGALRAYDTVPVAHERYPEARAAAVEVELRMRRCHELVLEALMLRGEWRDAEALERLRRAEQHWPREPSVQQWIAATEQRLQLFGERAVTPSTAATTAAPPAAPLGESRPAAKARPQRVEPASQRPAAPAVRTPSPQAVVIAAEPKVEARPASDVAPLPPRQASQPRPVAMAYREPQGPSDEPAAPRRQVEVEATPAPVADGIVAVPAPSGEDPVALALVSVEARLARGAREEAVQALVELLRRFPRDRRVQRRLGPLLHQRALMSYGQGMVSAAIADWRRVLELDPDNEAVRRLLSDAESESRRLEGK